MISSPTEAARGSARGSWSSRFGFILAAAGSAIGLGNIWRFPYTAGQNGGGAFVVAYLGFVVLIGVPVLIAEVSVGRATGRNPVGAFDKLAPGTPWRYVGFLGVVTGFGILAFYSVVAGWTLAYLYEAIVGRFALPVSPEESSALFAEITQGPVLPSLLALAFLVLTALVVQGGVSGGIERASRILMPTFAVLLAVLAIRALTLPGAHQGVAYLFSADFSKLNVRVLGSALGQALFSLSLGMGAMITYGSYLSKREGIPVAAASVAFFDTLVALLGGLIVFPVLFSAGGSPAQGPGLVFVAMPAIFDSLPAGTLFAVAFYALLGIAALTSTISLLEVTVAYFVDERGWRRSRAVWLLTAGCAALAVPSALSLGANAWLTQLGGGQGFLTLQSILWGNFSLSIGAMALCLFVGWKWGVAGALGEVESEGQRFALAPIWSFLVRFICPLAVAAILVYIIVTRNYF